MPKYRFTTDDGRRFDVSPDRVDLPNDEAAAREAQRALAGMATDRIGDEGLASIGAAKTVAAVVPATKAVRACGVRSPKHGASRASRANSGIPERGEAKRLVGGEDAQGRRAAALRADLGRDPDQRQLGKGFQRNALEGEAVAELSEALRDLPRTLQAQEVTEPADLDLAADGAFGPAIGRADVEPELAETGAGIERGMAAFELAAGKPSVEIEARLAVPAGDTQLQRRARRAVDQDVRPEQRPACGGSSWWRCRHRRCCRCRRRPCPRGRSAAAGSGAGITTAPLAGQIGAEGACDLLARLRQQRAAQMAENGVAHQPLVDHHRDGLACASPESGSKPARASATAAEISAS